jgi:hypothetical protein
MHSLAKAAKGAKENEKTSKPVVIVRTDSSSLWSNSTLVQLMGPAKIGMN